MPVLPIMRRHSPNGCALRHTPSGLRPDRSVSPGSTSGRTRTHPRSASKSTLKRPHQTKPGLSHDAARPNWSPFVDLGLRANASSPARQNRVETIRSNDCCVACGATGRQLARDPRRKGSRIAPMEMICPNCSKVREVRCRLTVLSVLARRPWSTARTVSKNLSSPRIAPVAILRSTCA